MTNIDSNLMRRVADGVFVALASALLASPFLAIGAFFIEIY